MIEFIEKSAHKAASHPKTYQSGSWVSVVAPTANELDQLANQFDLDRGNLTDALDADEVPRFERTDNHEYIFLRYALEKKDSTTKTEPLLLIINNQNFITVSTEVPPFLDKLTQADSSLDTTNPTQLFLDILDSIYDDYDFYIKNISRKIHHIVSKMHAHKLENEDFVNFVMIEDQISNFLGALTPMQAILHRVLVGSHTLLTANESDQMDDILLGIEQSINSCNSDSRRIISIREAYSTLSNNSLNRSMKALTAATLILALPNVVFGMYGMNIGLPIQDAAWAYPVIVGTTLIVIVLIIIWARKRRLF
jgi:magnesium transporter